MKKITVTCDRCGKGFDHGFRGWTSETRFKKIRVTEFFVGGSPIEFTYDLCSECTKELEKFLHGVDKV